MVAHERRGAIHLDHGEPSAGGRDGVAFPGVSLLANPQGVQLRLEGAPIDCYGLRHRFSSFPRVSLIILNTAWWWLVVG
jgi:hypothetical protein